MSDCSDCTGCHRIRDLRAALEALHQQCVTCNLQGIRCSAHEVTKSVDNSR